MNQNIIIVDLQGFKDLNNNFIVKEVAIASQEYAQTFLIKPPYSFHYLTPQEKSQVRFLERNRGIRWNEGFIDYKEFKRIIVPYLSDKKIITKGSEKIKWIKELCTQCEVIDLDKKKCPNLSILHGQYFMYKHVFFCAHHKIVCALNNVLCLKKWLFDNKCFLSLFENR